jgi:thiazole synthase
MVTVAVNRVPLDRKTESFLDHLAPEMQILPNTAGCYDADHAIRPRGSLAKLSKQMDKARSHRRSNDLLPDNEQTLEAAKVLVKEGFIVLPYFTDDLIMAKKLLDAGCPAVMPLARRSVPDGRTKPSNLRIMREQLPMQPSLSMPALVCRRRGDSMELGADAILMNTAIAEAATRTDGDRHEAAVEAGRLGTSPAECQTAVCISFKPDPGAI